MYPNCFIHTCGAFGFNYLVFGGWEMEQSQQSITEFYLLSGFMLGGFWKFWNRSTKFLKWYPRSLKWLRISSPGHWPNLSLSLKALCGAPGRGKDSIQRLFILQSQRLDQRDVLYQQILFHYWSLFGGWWNGSPCFHLSSIFVGMIWSLLFSLSFFLPWFD